MEQTKQVVMTQQFILILIALIKQKIAPMVLLIINTATTTLTVIAL